MTRYERDHIRSMTGYTPGEQPDDTNIVKLNTNENPYPASPKVGEALRHFDAAGLRKYPQPDCVSLREAIAAELRISPPNVLVTNGGDELLRMVFTTFCAPGARVLSTDPTYSLYSVLAALHQCDFAGVGLDNESGLPSSLLTKVRELAPSLVLIVNPHAPTGRLFTVQELAALARAVPGILLIDEAYVDFVAPEAHHNSLALIADHANVILLRTFSKGYSLAGLRLGFGIGDEALIAPMANKVRDSYNVDGVAQTLGLAAWQDQSHMRRNAARIRAERERVRAALTALGFDIPESHANFVYAKPPAGVSARGLYEHLRDKGVLVRFFADPGDALRISIGSQAENNALLSALGD